MFSEEGLMFSDLRDITEHGDEESLVTEYIVFNYLKWPAFTVDSYWLLFIPFKSGEKSLHDLQNTWSISLAKDTWFTGWLHGTNSCIQEWTRITRIFSCIGILYIKETLQERLRCTGNIGRHYLWLARQAIKLLIPACWKFLLSFP